MATKTGTLVPAGYFDRLVASLDEPDSAPALKRVVQRIARSPRIKPA